MVKIRDELASGTANGKSTNNDHIKLAGQQNGATTTTTTETATETEKASENESKNNNNNNNNNRLPEAKLELVARMRELLAAEFKERPEVYSRRHYEEIMDESSPNGCWRYLLQRDEEVGPALELAKSALAWRQENRVDALEPANLIKDFWLRAPIGFLGKSRAGNDLIYAIGKNFKKPDAIVRQTIRDFIGHLLMDWDRRHRHDLEQLELVFDVSETGFRNIDLDFASWLVSIRDFVPARVHAIYFVGVPFLMRPIIRLIISWLPARFKRIAHCITTDALLRDHITQAEVPSELGGAADDRWRLAPREAPWARDLQEPQANKIYAEICEACSFNTAQEHLDRLYAMQEAHEKSLLVG